MEGYLKINKDPEPEIRFEQGVRRMEDCAINMKKTFREGKEVGVTTGFQSIDGIFKWKKGYMYCITGYPNHGKTELMLQMMLVKSLHDGFKWAIYSPENYPVYELFDGLIHAYIGKTTDHRYALRMSETEYEDGMKFIGSHFIIVDPSQDPTPDLILKYFEYVIKTDKVDGCMIDPWNQMIHNYDQREDQYLSNEFTKIKRFARKYNQNFIITSHPKSPSKGSDGSLPVPDQYSLSGGAMWNNKFDVIGTVHRANYYKDKRDNSVEFITHKIKNQRLIGTPGTVELTFNRSTNRYYEMNGESPLQGVEIRL